MTRSGNILVHDVPEPIKLRVLERANDWHRSARVYESVKHTTQGTNEKNCAGHATSLVLREMEIHQAHAAEIFALADTLDEMRGSGTTLVAAAKAAKQLYPEDIAGYVELGAGSIGPWLRTIGPVAIALPWFPGFQNAQGGIMRPSGAREFAAGASLTHHACAVVGYDPRRKTCLGHKPMFLISSSTWSAGTSTAWIPEQLLYRYLRGRSVGFYTPAQLRGD